MPNLSAQEITAIESAFADHIQGLFKILLTARATDRQTGVDRFAAGIALARQTKDLALNATVGPAPAMMALARASGARKPRNR